MPLRLILIGLRIKLLNHLATNKAWQLILELIAHMTLCILGVLFLPPDVMVSRTNEPESDEVTKNNTNINKENILETGNARLSNI